jgi:PHP family Zn ribbon phosphoesterase
MGNISSDGRPILGVDSRDLFAALLDADERSILVPAHIWTPWFSALGANSGFDSIEECYGDLTSRIGAIETGLSSNPPMNWAVSSLDRFAIISNSDAHSPENWPRSDSHRYGKLLRGPRRGVTGGGPAGRIAGTVEFFPQEGKYHYEDTERAAWSCLRQKARPAGGAVLSAASRSRPASCVARGTGRPARGRDGVLPAGLRRY